MGRCRLHAPGKGEVVTVEPALTSFAATFVPAEVPRNAHLVFWNDEPQGAPPPNSDSYTRLAVGEHAVASLPTRRVSLRDALPILLALPAEAEVHRSVAFFAACGRTAVGYLAKGSILPSVTASGQDVWRLGVLDRGRATAPQQPCRCPSTRGPRDPLG